MSLSTAEIDTRLAGFTGAVASIEKNLSDLDEVIRSFAVAHLSGRSAEVWNAVAPKSSELWRCFIPFKQAVQQAVAARGSRPHLSVDQVADLTQRLTGTSVTLPESPSALLSTVLVDTSRQVTLDTLLATLSSSYQEVAGVANGIVAAWDAGGQRLTAITTALSSIHAMARQAAVEEPSELAGMDKQLASLKANLASDPMAAAGNLDGLAQQVEEMRISVQHAIDARAGLAARLAVTGQAIAALVQSLDAAFAQREQTVTKIARAARQLPDLAPLRDDLASLHAHLAAAAERASDWRLASRLLDELDGQLAAFRATVYGVTTSCQKLMDQRNEQRGLLDSYRAKASAVGRAEDPALASVYEAARASLYSAPCDVEAATALVHQYQQELNRPRGGAGS